MPKRSITVLGVAIMLLSSCSSGNESGAIPAAPGSVKAVQDAVKGKKYKTEKAGTHSPFRDDKEIEWLEPKAGDKFEEEIMADSKTFRIDFINDTAVTVVYKDKTNNGVYTVDDNTAEDEKPGVKLRVSYVDPDFTFGDGPPSKVTYTYLVEGISDKSILLETPRSMNRRKIVVLMNKL